MKPKSPTTERDEARSGLFDIEIERAKHRCTTLIDRIVSLPPFPSSSPSCYPTLLRLVHSELSFLSRLSCSNRNPDSNPHSLSLNVGYLEAIVNILQQPLVKGVSHVCKPIPLSPSVNNGPKSNTNSSSSVHVDIVCTLNGDPVWFFVSARNPKYISWHGSPGNKSLRTRIQQLLDAAVHSSPATKPSSIVLYFSNGLHDSVRRGLQEEFGASEFGIKMELPGVDIFEELEGDWVYVREGLISYQNPCVLKIEVDHSKSADIPRIECGFKKSILSDVGDLPEERVAFSLGDSFSRLVSKMKLCPLNIKDAEFSQQKDLLRDDDLVNFDTTALIALISGISNGGTNKLLARRESDLRQQFKSNFEFVISQVMSEIQNPIHLELECLLSGKRGMICESACSEFKELVSMCGGPNEKSRADQLLKYLILVPDCPSVRIMSLPTTRKLALKNKVVFGTGDYWRAPTVTANMAFLRAILQTGMSLFTIKHRPCSLVGD
ncbi:hypothetical protein NMG60_11035205 [Bertholletia excelsa]